MNLPATGWEIYYANGEVYDSKTSTWKDAPKDGVLIIIIWHDYHIPNVRQKTIMAGADYYYYRDENNWGVSQNYDEIKDFDFKRGVWTTDEEFETIHRVAFEKLDF